ncbi:MAG: VacJ family lipoprotein [Myxococcota bacterium]|nr:VacJ family lipoprotein [Myxococcales bacterium]
MARRIGGRAGGGGSGRRSLLVLLAGLCLLPLPATADDAPTAAEDGDGPGAGTAASESEPDPLFDDLFDEEFVEQPTGYPDPLEETNRGVFAFNQQVNKWILDPITEAYRWAVPKPGRDAIYRFFTNLGSTKTLVNDVLQLEWKDASVTTARLVINTSVGIAGFFDVAEKVGLEGHESDFGQTLALAGTPSGPYVMLPVLGPSNVRDGVGTVVDGFFQPTYYILGPSNLIIGPTEILLYGGGSGISALDRHYLELKALEDSSIDFYAAMRSGYYQDRVGEIWSRRPEHRTHEEP